MQSDEMNKDLNQIQQSMLGQVQTTLNYNKTVQTSLLASQQQNAQVGEYFRLTISI